MPARPAQNLRAYALWIAIIVLLAALLIVALVLFSSARSSSIAPLPTLVSFPATATDAPPATQTLIVPSATQTAITPSETSVPATLAVSVTPLPASSTPVTPQSVTETTPEAAAENQSSPVNAQPQPTSLPAQPPNQPATALPTVAASPVPQTATAAPTSSAPITQPDGEPFQGALAIAGGQLYVLQIERNAGERLRQAGITPPPISSTQEWVLVEMMFLCPAGVQCSLTTFQIQLQGASGQQYLQSTGITIEPAFRSGQNMQGQSWGYLAFISQRSERALWVTITGGDRSFYYNG
jgi:hypothetical protein